MPYLDAPRPQNERYGANIPAPQVGYGARYGNRRYQGMGMLAPDGREGPDEVAAKKSEALAMLDALDGSITKAQGIYQQAISDIQRTGVQAALADAQQQVGNVISAAQDFSSKTRATVSAIVPLPPGMCGSTAQPCATWAIADSTYRITDPIWHNLNDVIEPAISAQSGALTKALPILPNIVSGAQTAASQAAAAAASAAAAKAQADAIAQAQAQAQASLSANATINAALVQASSLAGQGNYPGAIAVLQTGAVLNAASQLGRTGDLTAAIASINAQQNQAANQAANQQAQAAAAAQAQAAQAAAQQQAAALAASQAQAQTAQQAQQQQFELSLEQMKEAAAERQQEFLASQASARDAATAQAQASAEQMKLLPVLLQAFTPQQTAATPSGTPNPIVLALISALSSGQSPLAALMAALQAQQQAQAPSQAPSPEPAVEPSLSYVQWGSTERF